MLASAPVALGGGPLEGENLVRFLYLDEAGTSNPKHETYLVVAGVLVHSDQQWKPLEEHLKKMAMKYAPKDHRQNFVFHAKELFSGGKIFRRDDYPREVRWAILDELCALPSKFNLPVIFGHRPRSEEANITLPSKSRPGDAVLRLLGQAYLRATSEAERWMRLNACSELATVVMEDNPQAKSTIESAHDFLLDERNGRILSIADMQFRKIVEMPLFSPKRPASILQIADACAFAIKRKLMGTPESDRFFGPISRQLTWKNLDP